MGVIMKNKSKFNLIVIIILLFMVIFNISITIDCIKINSELDRIQKEVEELLESLEAYSDNYVALWNTINNME